MAAPPGLSAPGSVSYVSETMTVGDGTWDAARNTYLLPNLVGLNFATMRYNGMGNRFKELPGYYNLIVAHAILAVITFLFIVPAAILTIRFSTHANRVRIHIWLQILTVLLATVVIGLGFNAVGPSRRLTNPHHGIGFALYLLILFQFVLGWRVHRKHHKARDQAIEPLKITLHHWLGRLIGLLGLIQIPLGLTLYGSPRYLFGLYSAVAFLWVAAYFHLSRRQSYESYRYEDNKVDYRTDRLRQSRHVRKGGNILAGLLAGIGLASLANKFESRSQPPEDHQNRQRLTDSRAHAEETAHSKRLSHTSEWQKRAYTVAASLGLAGLMDRYLDRREDRLRDAEDSHRQHRAYHSPHSRRPDRGPDQDISGRGPQYRHPGGYLYDPRQPYSAPQFAQYRPPGQITGGMAATEKPGPSSHPSQLHHSPSLSSLSSSYDLSTQDDTEQHPVQQGRHFRNGLATLGFSGVMKRILFGKRPRYEHTQDETNLTTSPNTTTARPRPQTSDSDRIAESLTQGRHPSNADNVPALPQTTSVGHMSMPPWNESASVPRISPEERERRRLEALPLGGIYRPTSRLQEPMPEQSRQSPPRRPLESYTESSITETVPSYTSKTMTSHNPLEHGNPARTSQQRQRTPSYSPERQAQEAPGDSHRGSSTSPINVRVKLHKDGRHVTVRRLPQSPSAPRPNERVSDYQSRSDSFSDLGEMASPQRFRRDNSFSPSPLGPVAATAGSPAQHPGGPVRSPVGMSMPLPSHHSSPRVQNFHSSGFGSPATFDGMTTDASADYADNRRRRRAERARDQQIIQPQDDQNQQRDQRSSRPTKTVGFRD